MENLQRLFLVFGLVFTNISNAQLGQFFEGHWSCKAADSHLNFQWEAHLIMDGHWLSGKTMKQGVLLSSDFWKIEKNGQPSVRKVFLADGSFVESETAGWKKQKIVMTGQLHEKKNVTEIRETIKMKSDDLFDAITQKKVDDKWVFQSKEVCERRKAN